MGELYIFERDSKRIMRNNIILIVLAAIAALAALLFFAYCLLLDKKTIFKVTAYAVVTVVDVLVVIHLIKEQLERHEYFLSELEKLTDISEINSQAEYARRMLGAFCMLDNYLYVPKQRLLVLYTDIESINAHRVSVNFIPASATIDFKCRNGRYYSVRLNSAFDFNRRYGEFVDALNEKRRVCFTQNIKN